MGVIAIRRDEVIVGPRRRDRADHDGFLADVKMAEAANLLRLILLTRPLLETPDQQHQREHLDFVALLRRLHAGLSGVRYGGGRAGPGRAATELHAENKEPGEEEIAQERVPEKHPGRRGAVLRQTDCERLNQAREIFCVTGIAQPREGIRDDVKKSRAGERSGQQRFQRRAISDEEAETPDQEQREIAASDERIEERRAVMNVQDDVRKEERNEWDGEFVFAREINRAAK